MEEIDMGTAERCDHRECAARGLVRAEFVTGALFFCGHHWREVGSAATETAVFVVDERELSSDRVPQAA
jgi:hypothetical protein